jgi:hypothetical protein
MVTRALFFGALAAVPALAAIAMPGPEPTVSAQCTAAFGSINDGMCLDQPAPAQQPGVPSFNVGGPGQGITTSPLFPGQTINIPLGPSG